VQDYLNAALGDRYLVERELGRGGMASVWLARDLRLDRHVALKVLDPELAGAIGVERFLREIRVTARIQHPNIISVLDSGVCSGPGGESLPWFTMTYVAGESLRQRLSRDRQLPIDDAIRIAESAAAALQTAHANGVVHRDIKPENLLLAGDHTYVADFGIAKAVLDTSTERLTNTGVVIGTPAYMSPEQATSEVVDDKSDQYALATVVYELLAGEPPFTGATAQAIVSRRLAEPARQIRSVRTTVPEWVEAAVLRALERVPSDRFASVSDFAAALRNPTISHRAAPRLAVFGWRAAVSALLLVTAAAAGTFAVRGLRSEHASPSPAAQALYQRGMSSYAKRTPDGVADALDAFKAAIRLDSTYGEAWAGLAKTYVRAYERRFVFLGSARDSALRLALSAFDRALAADPRNADAWLTKGMVHRQVDPTDDAPALRSFRQAVAIDSTLAQAWQQIGNASMEAGQADSALAAWRRAVAVAPTYAEGASFLALGHFWRRQYDSASRWADSALTIDPAFVLARQIQGQIAVEQGNFVRGAAAFRAQERIGSGIEVVNSLAGEALVSARAGRRSEARTFLTRAESLAARFSPTALHTAVYMAIAYGAAGDNDRAIAWLERYVPSADLHFQLHLRCEPPFDAIATDPRFRALLIVAKPTPPQGC
jgi:tetratricopeptide (TPR) repeat protein